MFREEIGKVTKRDDEENETDFMCALSKTAFGLHLPGAEGKEFLKRFALQSLFARRNVVLLQKISFIFWTDQRSCVSDIKQSKKGAPMRIFPKSRHGDDKALTPQSILAGCLLAVKGSAVNDIELMHLSSTLAGPSSDNYQVRAQDLKELVQSADRLLGALGLGEFITQSANLLSEKQKLATLVTIMDLCMVENSLFEGEKSVFDQIRSGFNVSDDDLRPFAELLILKNEPSIRLNVLPDQFSSAAQGFRSLV